MSRASEKRYFVYVLWSDSARCFYIGISEDPHHRLQQHKFRNSGLVVAPCSLAPCYVELKPDYRKARQRENELKKQKRGIGFWSLTGLNPLDFPRRSSAS